MTRPNARERLKDYMDRALALLDDLGYHEASVHVWDLDSGPAVTIFRSTPEMRAKLREKFGKPTLTGSPGKSVTATAKWSAKDWHTTSR